MHLGHCWVLQGKGVCFCTKGQSDTRYFRGSQDLGPLQTMPLGIWGQDRSGVPQGHTGAPPSRRSIPPQGLLEQNNSERRTWETRTQRNLNSYWGTFHRAEHYHRFYKPARYSAPLFLTMKGLTTQCQSQKPSSSCLSWKKGHDQIQYCLCGFYVLENSTRNVQPPIAVEKREVKQS